MKYVFISRKNNSAKIWGCDLFENQDGSARVIWYWGPVGKYMSELSKKKTKYNRFFDAHDAVMEKIKEKERKGYLRCSNSSYFDAVMKFRIEIEKLIEKENTSVKEPA